jgi:ribosome-associated translation inhibitor RaiA
MNDKEKAEYILERLDRGDSNSKVAKFLVSTIRDRMASPSEWRLRMTDKEQYSGVIKELKQQARWWKHITTIFSDKGKPMTEKTVKIEVPEEFHLEIQQKLHDLEREKRKKIEVTKNMQIIFNYWKENCDFIDSQFLNKETQEVDADAQFKWLQLVWQELEMWTRLNEVVYLDEFEHICRLRGFNDAQKNFLIAGLGAIRLRNFDFRDKQDQMDAVAYHM